MLLLRRDRLVGIEVAVDRVELQASTRRGGVDALLEHQEIDLALAELRRQVQQVARDRRVMTKASPGLR